jgi:oxygen-dependent protoporphyrinogen oxidase
MEGFTQDLSTSFVDAIVIGGGVAGLTAAFELKKSGRSVLLLEKTARTGGVVQSIRSQGYLIELGPNTVQNDANLVELISELDLEKYTRVAPASTPRYIQKERRLHPVPLSPLKLLFSGLLDRPGKWRIVREAWTPRERFIAEESLQQFSERRFGVQFTQLMLAPFVAGVWAGDISRLSVAAFPKLTAWEQTYGGVIRGALLSRRHRPPAPPIKRGLVSFDYGLQTLTDALTGALGSSVQTNRAVDRVARVKDAWHIAAGADVWRSKLLIIALPGAAASALLKDIDVLASAAIGLIPYAPLAVVHLGFPAGAVKKAQHGFGFLNLPSERQDILGCVWNSDIFPDRAPEEHTLMTVFCGGALNPAMAALDDQALVNQVLSSLGNVMDIHGRPDFEHVARYSKAIPQYTLGHLQRIGRIADAEAKYPGLAVIGNIRGGISMGDVIRSSKTSVSRLLLANTHQTP